MFDIADNSMQPEGAKIKVIGVGGGGCNAVNTMIRAGLVGVEYIVANTDSQALAANLAGTKIQLGGNVTKGLGAGANPEVGRKAAIEDYERLSEVLDGADMVFVTAGMGGGTGTGAAPVIAKLARELGALTVGVVTKPFIFEGKKRSRQAEEGIRALEDSVDSLICIPNQRLLQLAGENLSLVDTFKAADEVLLNAVQGISDLINNTGLINADFADVATVMTNKGLSLMGTGTATGSERAIKAAKQAISSPLLEDVSINGATGIIINISGNNSLTTHETNQAVTLIMEAADEEAEIIFGTVIDENLGDSVKVTVIATGLQTARKEAREANVNPVNHNRPLNSPSVYETYQSSSQNISVATPTPVAPISSAAPKNENIEQQRTILRAETNKTELPRVEAREEVLVHNPRNDYAVKSEITFDLKDQTSSDSQSNARPKINWAEKLQSAASKYDSQKSFEGQKANIQASSTQTPKPLPVVERQDYSHFDNSEPASTNQASQSAQNRESRIKSIADKLGFFNFDEDEFDTPSFMKKNERNQDTKI
jgi:cell division protein FtsZ